MTNEMKINKCGCGGEARLVLAHSNCIKCRKCGAQTRDCTIYVSQQIMINEWNTAHPEISPAMQAVKLLEQGEWIEEQETKQIMQLRNNKIFVLYQDEDYAKETRIDLSTLFVRTWQLYEEPKYKEITADEALTDFALNGRNEKIVCKIDGQEFSIKSIDNRIELSSSFTKSRAELQNLTWVKYD